MNNYNHDDELVKCTLPSCNSRHFKSSDIYRIHMLEKANNNKKAIITKETISGKTVQSDFDYNDYVEQNKAEDMVEYTFECMDNSKEYYEEGLKTSNERKIDKAKNSIKDLFNTYGDKLLTNKETAEDILAEIDNVNENDLNDKGIGLTYKDNINSLLKKTAGRNAYYDWVEDPSVKNYMLSFNPDNESDDTLEENINALDKLMDYSSTIRKDEKVEISIPNSLGYTIEKENNKYNLYDNQPTSNGYNSEVFNSKKELLEYVSKELRAVEYNHRINQENDNCQDEYDV